MLLCTTTKIAHNTPQYYFVFQRLRKVLPKADLYYYKSCTQYPPASTTSYCKSCISIYSQYYFVLRGCAMYFQVLLVLLRNTKLARNTSQYYFALQKLHKVLFNANSYYKACAKLSPVYFVLQRLHMILRSNTFQYQRCPNNFPALLRTTKFRKVLPRTALHYKDCTKLSPVLLRTTKVAHGCSQDHFLLQILHESLHKALSSSTSYFVLQRLIIVFRRTTFYYKCCTKNHLPVFHRGSCPRKSLG